MNVLHCDLPRACDSPLLTLSNALGHTNSNTRTGTRRVGSLSLHLPLPGCDDSAPVGLPIPSVYFLLAFLWTLNTPEPHRADTPKTHPGPHRAYTPKTHPLMFDPIQFPVLLQGKPQNRAPSSSSLDSGSVGYLVWPLHEHALVIMCSIKQLNT